jgi:hypothetical protein
MRDRFIKPLHLNDNSGSPGGPVWVGFSLKISARFSQKKATPSQQFVRS